MKYPLQAARDLREREVEDAQGVLAQAVELEHVAGQALEETQRKLQSHDEESAETREREARVQVRSAHAMQQGQAFLRRRRIERDALREEVACAQTHLAEARTSVESARVALAQTRAEAKAVEKHYERWKVEQRKKADKRDEEEAEDLVSSRHGRE